MGRGNNGIGHVWAVNTSAGDAGRPNGVGPVWIENISAVGGGGGGSFTGVSHDNNLSGDGLNSPLGIASDIYVGTIGTDAVNVTASNVAYDEARAFIDTNGIGFEGMRPNQSNTVGVKINMTSTTPIITINEIDSNDRTSFTHILSNELRGEYFSVGGYKLTTEYPALSLVDDAYNTSARYGTSKLTLNDGADHTLDISGIDKVNVMPRIELVDTSAAATDTNVLYVVTGSN